MRVGPSVLADLAPVFKGESRFVSPRPESERIPEVKKSAYTRPIVWFAAPVRAPDGRVIAALELGIYAEARFTSIFGLSWLTDSESTVDAYAFDDAGLLLTKSRYFPQLSAAGMLPPTPVPPRSTSGCATRARTSPSVSRAPTISTNGR